VYAAAPPVIVARPTAVAVAYAPTPTVIAQPAPAGAESAVMQAPSTLQISAPVQPVSATVVAPPRTLTLEEKRARVASYLQQLTSAQAATRIDAVQHLTRLRGPRAVDGLAATLAGDPSPAVRQAAARGLGITGAPRGLPSLQRAAAYDPDLNVRRSAQLALEVVQSLPRR
jgi:HEAT repeat protein